MFPKTKRLLKNKFQMLAKLFYTWIKQFQKKCLSVGYIDFRSWSRNRMQAFKVFK